MLDIKELISDISSYSTQGIAHGNGNSVRSRIRLSESQSIKKVLDNFHRYYSSNIFTYDMLVEYTGICENFLGTMSTNIKHWNNTHFYMCSGTRSETRSSITQISVMRGYCNWYLVDIARLPATKRRIVMTSMPLKLSLSMIEKFKGVEVYDYK